jgi:hypothetical protein
LSNVYFWAFVNYIIFCSSYYDNIINYPKTLVGIKQLLTLLDSVCLGIGQ